MTGEAIDAGDDRASQPLGTAYWAFFVAQTLCISADAIAAMSVPWYVLKASGSTAVVSGVITPALLTRILLLPTLSPLADRFSRKKLAVIGGFVRVAALAGLALQFRGGGFRAALVAMLYLLLFAGWSIGETSFLSAVPQIVRSNALFRASRMIQAVKPAAELLGALVGGAVLGNAGALPFLVALGSAAAGSVLLCVVRFGPRSEPRAARYDALSWASDVGRAVDVVRRCSLLLGIVSVAVVLHFLFLPLPAFLLPAFVQQASGLPAWYLGALLGAVGVGRILAFPLLGWLCRRLPGDSVMALGVVAIGAGVALLPWAPAPWLSIPLAVGIGAGIALATVPVFSHLMVAIPNAFRSRIFSLVACLVMCSVPAGVALMQPLISGLGYHALFASIGLLILLVAPSLRAIPHLREVMSESTDDGALAGLYPRVFGSQSGQQSLQTGLTAESVALSSRVDDRSHELT